LVQEVSIHALRALLDPLGALRALLDPLGALHALLDPLEALGFGRAGSSTA
jgi:hypothetical protein